MQRITRAGTPNTEESPVIWYRHLGGEARDWSPGNLAQKYDIAVLKWAQLLTRQWGQKPGKLQKMDPESTVEMPDAYPQFNLTYVADKNRIAPYQPWPEEPPEEQSQNPTPNQASALQILSQPKQGTR